MSTSTPLFAALISLALAGNVVAQTAPAKPKAAAPVAAVALKPGLWEQVLEVDAAGAATKRTVTSRLCLTEDDSKTLRRLVPLQPDASMKCELRDLRPQGADLTWKLTCTGAQASLAGSGRITLAADSYAGSASLESRNKGGKPTKVAQKISAKWLDACM